MTAPHPGRGMAEVPALCNASIIKRVNSIVNKLTARCEIATANALLLSSWVTLRYAFKTFGRIDVHLFKV